FNELDRPRRKTVSRFEWYGLLELANVANPILQGEKQLPLIVSTDKHSRPNAILQLTHDVRILALYGKIELQIVAPAVTTESRAKTDEVEAFKEPEPALREDPFFNDAFQDAFNVIQEIEDYGLTQQANAIAGDPNELPTTDLEIPEDLQFLEFE
ncbi:unnamed protein product, partial [Allacma fusca]